MRLLMVYTTITMLSILSLELGQQLSNSLLSQCGFWLLIGASALLMLDLVIKAVSSVRKPTGPTGELL